MQQFMKDSIQLTAGSLGVPTVWLENAMWLENEQFDPAVTNGIGATGLIQFTRSTAKALGTTTDALRRMSFVEQMKFVELYLKRAIATYGKPRDFISFYCLIFHPAFVAVDNTAKLPAGAYVGNRFLDLNHDGNITKGELLTHVNLRLAKKKVVDVASGVIQTTKDGIKHAVDVIKSDTDAAKPGKILIIASLIAASFFIIRRLLRRNN